MCSTLLKGQLLLRRRQGSRACFANLYRYVRNVASCQKWSSRDLARSFSSSLALYSFPPLSVYYFTETTLRQSRPLLPRIAMIVPFIQIIGGFSVRYRVLYRTTLLYKIVKPMTSLKNDDDRSAKVNRRHWFWRVLALEEFTDVQCVIVDHPMPSLAGDRGSSKDHRPSNSHSCPLLHQDLARYLSMSLDIPFGNLSGIYDERCNLVFKRTI